MYDILNDYIFTKYKLKQHIMQESKKRKAIRKGVLGYYCDRVGVVGVKKVTNNTNSQDKNKHKANKGNLNHENKRPRKKQTKAGRAIQREENRKKKQQEKERAAIRKAWRRKQKGQQQKNKKVKIKDILDKVGIEQISQKYALYVQEQQMRKRSLSVIEAIEDNEDDPDDEDETLIAECVDYLSDTESEADEDQNEVDMQE